MKIIPTEKWLEQFRVKKNELISVSDLNNYFLSDTICGQKIESLSLGKISVPSGDLVVCDLFVGDISEEYLSPYFRTTPTGEFPVTVSVVLSEDDSPRYAAVKLIFTGNEAVKYEEALIGNEEIDSLEEGEYFGFIVDSGLAAILDAESAKAYSSFLNNWQIQNPTKNIYDNYFADLFEESCRMNPKYQRSAGDWLNWTIPGTELKVLIIQTGFGDGVYPVFWGFDKDGQICNLIIQFIDIDLSYGSEEENDE